MKARRDLATLREAVRSSAFTPAGRDIGALVELLADDDEAVAKGAEVAIVRAGTGLGAGAVVLTRLLKGLETAPGAARSRGFRAIGRMAPKDVGTAAALIAGLSDADPRVQRGAAHALGRLRGSLAKAEIAAALLNAWDEAPPLPLARALAEAMGKLGLPEATERLASAEGGDAELSRIARNAVMMLDRDGSRGETSEIDGGRVTEVAVEVVFACRGGLEALVAEEVREKCDAAREVRAGAVGSGRVTARWRGATRDLFAVRTALGFGFALPTEPLAGDADLEAATVRALSSVTARRLLDTLTRGNVRYRVDWEGKGRGRGRTWRVVHAIAAASPSWVNDPTESTWQVSLTAGAGELRCLLVPRKLADPRFLYRVRDVPAASHPTLAAALVRASRPLPDDVVWDPFVGSGTELVERARAGPYRALLGSDLAGEALECARENASAAGVLGVGLEIGDATSYAPQGITRILTNPPMGRRVARDGSLAHLLDRFTDHAAGVLAPGGILAWLSPLGGRTAARAEASGLRVVLRQSVDMGGFHAELQVWEKPKL